MNKKIYTIVIVLAVISGFLMGLSNFSGTLFNVGLILFIITILSALIIPMIRKKNIKKNRTTTIFNINSNEAHFETLETTIQQFLSEKNFKKINYVNDETVYQLGSGLWTARKYLAYHFENNTLILESWVSTSAGKGFGEEIPLDNKFFAKVPKDQLKKIIDELAIKIAEIN